MSRSPSIARSAALMVGAWAAAACGSPGTDVASDGVDTQVDAVDTEPAVTPVPDSIPDDTDAEVTAEPQPPAFGGSLVDLSAPWQPGGDHEIVVEAGMPFVAGRSPTHGQLFPADLDGDGVAELIVGNGAASSAVPADAKVFRTTAALSGFTYDAALSAAVLQSAQTAPFGFVDLDGDGRGDLVYAHRDATLRRGEPGGWAAAEGVPYDPEGPPFNLAFGLALHDTDRDGLLDLLLAEQDCAASGLAWRHVGGGRLLFQHIRADSDTPQRTCCLATFPGNHGVDVVMPQGDVCDRSLPPHGGFIEATGLDAAGWPTYTAYDRTGPDGYWRTDPITGGGPYTRAMPMGAGVADLDGDGLYDLLLSLSVDHEVLLLGQADGTFVDQSVASGMVLRGRFGNPPLLPDTPWSIGLTDLDQDGRTDVLVATGDDASEFRVVDGPPFRSAAFWNAGGGRFVEITQDIGLDIDGNWQSLVLADPDGDGDADIYLGGWGRPGRFLRNDLTTDHHGFSLRLQGTTSNALGLGARVEVEVAGAPTTTHLMVVQGSAAPLIQPTLFVGLGEATMADTVRVVWPSGTVQEVHDLAAGQQHILTEPPVLTLSEATRHVPADSTSVVTLTVTPRAADGSIRAVGAVTARRIGGSGVLGAVSGPDAEGVWQVSLRAGVFESSSVVEISIDGVPVGVRPRVWFTAP